MESNGNRVRSDAQSKDDPFVGAEELAKYFVQKWAPRSEIQSSDFADSPEPLQGASNESIRRRILRTLGVMTITVGRNGPAKIAADAMEAYPQVLSVARLIWERLQRPDGRVLPNEINRIMDICGCPPDRLQDSINLIKQLGLAVGVQRSGGLRRADLAAKEVEEKLSSLQSAPDDDEAIIEEAVQEEAERNWERESTYYEYIAALVDSWDGYEAAIVGGRQIGRGEWSTPDIVAVSVDPAPSLVVPIVRIVTVEVKLEMSRLAIAEARAHRRFSHYTYVGTPQAPIEMDPLIVSELAATGIGLICPRQRGSLTFHVYLEAQLHRPDEEEVELLLQRFTASDGRSMSKATHDRIRAALSVLFAS